MAGANFNDSAAALAEAMNVVDLPEEMLRHILTLPELSMADVARFGSTCRILRDFVLESKDLWHSQLKSTWPELYKMLCLYYLRTMNETDIEFKVDWLAETRFRCELPARMLPVMKAMANSCFDKSQLTLWYPELAELMAFGDLTPTAPFHVLHFCQSLIFDKDEHSRMSLKYHLKDFLREFIQQFHWVLMPELTEMMQGSAATSVDNFPVERVAAYLCQWSDIKRCINYEVDVQKPIDDLAARWMAMFAIDHPSDWVLRQQGMWEQEENGVWKYVGPRSAREMLDSWAKKAADVEGWRFPPHGRNVIVMRSIMKYMMSNDGWRTQLPDDEANNSLVDVLREQKGWAYLVSVVMAAVALRLGVICRLQKTVIGPTTGETKILWYSYEMGSGNVLVEEVERYVIVMGRACALHTYGARPPTDNVLSDIPKVVRAWGHTVIDSSVGRGPRCFALESVKSMRTLTALAVRDPVSMAEGLRSIYLQGQLAGLPEVKFRDLFHPKFFTTVKPASSLLEAALDYPFVGHAHVDRWNSRHRSPDGLKSVFEGKEYSVNWAVGMIIHHKRYDYVGVIYRWDPVCQAPPEWRSTMRVADLDFKDKQPFYGVFVEDGSERYVAQENLELATRTCPPSTNVLIARNFDEYRGTYYVPNEKLAAVFPDDEGFRNHRLSQLAHGDQ